MAMCVECEDTLAAVRCEDCDDLYCPLCFKAQHQAGSRLHHRPTEVPGSSSSSSSSDIGVSPMSHHELSTKPLIEHVSPPEDIPAIVPPLPPPVAVTKDVTADQKEALEAEDSDDDDELMMREIEAVPSALMKEAAFIPLRLSEDERALFNLLDAALNVSEYTDAVDVLSSYSTVKRMLRELNETFGVLSGLLIANNFREGRRLVQQKQFKDNEDFFGRVFEIGRRYKVMNPERMRNNYGKMIYLLQDANVREIQKYLGFSCVSPIKTVATLLEERRALDMLRDTRCAVATSVAAATSPADAQSLQCFLRDKQQAIDGLVRDYSSASLSEEEIRLCLASIADGQSYLASNRAPITRMIEYLEKYFKPEKPEPGFSLEIKAGRNGARLSHSHASQYEYVLQSLLLWKNITTSMLRLWWAVEEDLLGGGMYRLRDTGQGLNRMQHAPETSRLVHSILNHTQKMRPRWVGSSMVHLGDHNVPNALMFIDKYTQISRILSPIVNTVHEIPVLAVQSNTRAYIEDSFGGAETLRKRILCDFFKHGFDGSGADNFFDAGSCIDGRLTSAWNWCSRIEKKSFFYVFLMAGFVGFDGHFEK
uniref:B box-type domain-containing protein n=1 Tax=Peronospora matthiolae TaxID=2874970 RepID=A0AAV1T4Z0_9STRA